MYAKRSVIAFISTLALTTACATYRPVIDTRGVDSAKYERDLAECQRYAEAVSPGASAALGAIAGAAIGLALAVVAGSGYDRGASAAVGAVSGGAIGGASGAESQMDVIRRCLAGRGYSVLQ